MPFRLQVWSHARLGCGVARGSQCDALILHVPPTTLHDMLVAFQLSVVGSRAHGGTMSSDQHQWK